LRAGDCVGHALEWHDEHGFAHRQDLLVDAGTTEYGLFGSSADHRVRGFLKEDGATVKSRSQRHGRASSELRTMTPPCLSFFFPSSEEAEVATKKQKARAVEAGQAAPAKAKPKKKTSRGK
jgi:hypothetical protein